MGMFMSLEDFLALPPGSIVLHAPASHWLAAYRTAKASFETYGDAGPPIGSVVESLVSGYGGREGRRLRFDGVDTYDPEHFLLSAGGYEFLCDRSTWWREIKVIVPAPLP